MSYQLQVLADAPFSYWTLDGSGPVFNDAAGSFRQADLTGSAVSHPALVSGSGNALALKNTNRLEMDDPVFNKGYEARQFSLEVWVKPLDITGQISIMSHSGAYDGLTITPNMIYFRTKYLTAGTNEVSYKYRTSKAFHVVGVHTSGKNSLYVDGQLVAESDITEDQLLDAYSFLTTDLIAGESSTSSSIAIDAPSIYAYALSGEIISNHYKNGVDVDTSEAISGFNTASHWNFSDEGRNIAVYKNWQVGSDWASGVLIDTVVIGDVIAPSYTQVETEEVVDGLIVPVYTNTSIAGTWVGSIELGMAPETNLADARLNWTGEGEFTIEYSIDNGATWQVPTDAGATSLTNEDSIGVRVTFAGGIEDDTSYVDFIEVVAYTDKIFKGTRVDREASLNGTGTASPQFYEPIEYADVNGIRIISGSIDVGIDSSYEGEEEPGDLDINGVDLWIKPVSGNIVTTGSRSISRSGDTISFTGFSNVVVNGQAVTNGATVFASDSWYHIAAIFSAPGNYPLSIGSAGDIVAQASAIYGDLSLPGLHQIYDAYLGIPGLTVDDSSVVEIDEASPTTKLYAHVWGITAAG